MARIKLVTFDLDDTLWAVGPVIVNAERVMWAWLGEHCPEMPARFDRERLLPVREEVLQQTPQLAHDISELRVRVLNRAIRECGYGVHEAEVLAATAFSVFMDARHQVGYFEQVHDVLSQLQQGYTLAALSNGNADVRRLPIGRFFSFAFSAASVRASKPAPDMFEAALTAARCEPQQMIHVGDHHEHDIAAAQELGIHTVWVNPERAPFPGERKASGEISGLAELPVVVAKIDRGE